jgi:hypothetical protein
MSTPSRQILINGVRPLALNRKRLKQIFGERPKLVARMLHASRNGDLWLDFVTNKEGIPGSEVTVTTESAEWALERLKQGEEPPLLPSERARKTASHRKQLKRYLPKVPLPPPTPDDLTPFLCALPSGLIRLTVNPETGTLNLEYDNGLQQFIRLRKNAPPLTISFVPSSSAQIIQSLSSSEDEDYPEE